MRRQIEYPLIPLKTPGREPLFGPGGSMPVAKLSFQDSPFDLNNHAAYAA